MKKTKLEKGITLIALIITIIILLILAVITIRSIKKDGIIDYAQDASTDYKKAQEEEQITLGYSEYKIELISNPNAKLKVQGATVAKNGNNGWIVKFESGNSYPIAPDGNIGSKSVVEPVVNPDPDGWDIAFIHNGTSWVDTRVTSEQELEGAKIVAKFYEQELAEKITPGALPLNPSSPITFDPSDKVYTLYIEGTGDMGTLITFDEDNFPTEIHGYQIGVGGVLGQPTTEQFLMPYVTEIVICDGITNIGAGAFAASTSLQKLTISSTVKEISNHAFICTSLNDLVIPGSVTRIGTSAFEGSQIRNLVIEEGVKEIGERAFCFCSLMEKISFPNSLTTIGKQAFDNCEYVENIIIPANVTTIGEEAFYYCDNLTNVYIESENISVGAKSFDGTSNLTIYVKNANVAAALTGKIGSNTTVSSDYNWITPEI